MKLAPRNLTRQSGLHLIPMLTLWGSLHIACHVCRWVIQIGGIYKLSLSHDSLAITKMQAWLESTQERQLILTKLFGRHIVDGLNFVVLFCKLKVSRSFNFAGHEHFLLFSMQTFTNLQGFNWANFYFTLYKIGKIKSCINWVHWQLCIWCLSSSNYFW